MSKEGERYAAELKRLEERRKELEDAFLRLARDEAEALEVAELVQEINRLELHVETARAAAKMEKTMTMTMTMTNQIDIKKAASENRRKVEVELDKLAKFVQQDGETFEKAYDRALDTDLGKSLMRTRDDAQELERGGITSMDVVEARKRLNG